MDFRVEISGLDALQKRLAETASGIEALSGDIAHLEFNPHDDTAVAAAIQQMERAIDERAAPYRTNRDVMQMAANLKQSYTARIGEMVRSAREESG